MKWGRGWLFSSPYSPKAAGESFLRASFLMFLWDLKIPIICLLLIEFHPNVSIRVKFPLQPALHNLPLSQDSHPREYLPHCLKWMVGGGTLYVYFWFSRIFCSGSHSLASQLSQDNVNPTSYLADC